jgi:heterodisulfide reductase subunit C
MEAMDEDTILGVGQVEQFTFDRFLDFQTCTECGRCQSQCPAWNTGKPLSPKMLIQDLRDHMYAKGPFLLGQVDEAEAGDVIKIPLVGDKPGEAAVIDYDVLWSCTMCGACVEECPVDIQHVDTIADLRRYKAMMESSFPQEAGVMLRNIENSGDPWGVGQQKREEWTEKLDFEIPRAEPGVELPEEIDHLLWVGCSGAVDDRSRKITVSIAQLLHDAGIKFAILGNNEMCTGDSPRRLGHGVPVPDARRAERRDAELHRRRQAHDHHPVRPLLQRHQERVPRLRRPLRGGPPQRAVDASDRRRPPGRDQPAEPVDHLPRPLLPRPPQRRLRRPARRHQRRSGHRRQGDAEVAVRGLLLWRRWGAHVDGGDDRRAGQQQPCRRGGRDRRRHRRDRLPVLRDDALRRRCGEGRQGQLADGQIEVLDIAEVLARGRVSSNGHGSNGHGPGSGAEAAGSDAEAAATPADGAADH